MAYLNVDLDFFEHPKTKRLEARCGDNSYVYLINLWRFAGKYRPADGDLSSYTVQEIECFAKWSGEPGVFFKAISEVGFLDTDLLDLKRLHDWTDHQGHLVAFKERASVAAKARWEKLTPKSRKRKTIQKGATSMQQASNTHASSMLSDVSRNAPTIPTKPTKPTIPDEVIGEAPPEPDGENLTGEEKANLLSYLGVKKREKILSGDVVVAIRKWIGETYPDLTATDSELRTMAGKAYSTLLRNGLGKHWEEFAPEPPEFFISVLEQGLGEIETEKDFYAHLGSMCDADHGEQLNGICHKARRRSTAEHAAK